LDLEGEKLSSQLVLSTPPPTACKSLYHLDPVRKLRRRAIQYNRTLYEAENGFRLLNGQAYGALDITFVEHVVDSSKVVKDEP
jgi:hypothetical protein